MPMLPEWLQQCAKLRSELIINAHSLDTSHAQRAHVSCSQDFPYVVQGYGRDTGASSGKENGP